MTNMLPTNLALSVGLLASVLVCPVEAASVERIKQSNAVGICQPALPAYDGQIRKRPRALQNEGTSMAFVTCAYTYNWAGDSRVDRFVVNVNNKAAVPQSVTCTAVYGVEGQQGVPANSIKTMSVAPNNTGFFAWTTVDFGNAPLPARLAVSVSCQLPPQSGINFGSIAYSEDVGQ